MSEKVEQVARAIWERRRAYAAARNLNLEEWGDGNIPRLNGVFDEARDAIEAMREPTGAMLKQGIDTQGGNATEQATADSVWRAMIATALR